MCNICVDKQEDIYPNWIITDLRFPNELKAIKDNGGFSIRVIRECYKLENNIHHWYDDYEKGNLTKVNAELWTKEESLGIHRNNINENAHKSETALDNAKFDYVIENNGTINELIEKVKKILIKENIL